MALLYFRLAMLSNFEFYICVKLSYDWRHLNSNMNNEARKCMCGHGRVCMCKFEKTVMSVGAVDILPLKCHELLPIKARVTQALLV
jgi:hypothetical protein